MYDQMYLTSECPWQFGYHYICIDHTRIGPIFITMSLPMKEDVTANALAAGHVVSKMITLVILSAIPTLCMTILWLLCGQYVFPCARTSKFKQQICIIFSHKLNPCEDLDNLLGSASLCIWAMRLYRSTFSVVKRNSMYSTAQRTVHMVHALLWTVVVWYQFICSIPSGLLHWN